jgi:H/ACA ribonucleoprotein complex subunit 2
LSLFLILSVLFFLLLSSPSTLLIAGNITPIDVVSHLPVLCENNSVPYVYVPSKEELGIAGATKRPTSCILVQDKKGDSEYNEIFGEVQSTVKKMKVSHNDDE